MTAATSLAPETLGAVPAFLLAILIGIAPVAVVLWVKAMLFRQSIAEEKEEILSCLRPRGGVHEMRSPRTETSGRGSRITTTLSSFRSADRSRSHSRSRGASATR